MLAEDALVGKPVMPVPHLTDVQIALEAQRLREEYFAFTRADKISRIEPEKLVWDFLDEQERLSLDTESSLGNNNEGHQIAGQMLVREVGGMIKIDATIARLALYPFTLAHEIGHWRLHRQFVIRWLEMLRASGDNTTEFLTLNRDLGHNLSHQVPTIEWQANRFATHLLMPGDLVGKHFKRCYGTGERRYSELIKSQYFKRGFSDPMEYAQFMAKKGQSPCVTSMADEFRTSVKSMALRLQELQLV